VGSGKWEVGMCHNGIEISLFSMSNPWRGFTQQPWLELAKVAGVTLLAVIAVEWFLAGLWSLGIPAIRFVLGNLLAPPLGEFMPLLATFGLGALGLYFSERWRQPLALNRGSLWALVLCLAVALGIKGALPLPIFPLTQFSYPGLVMIILGVFFNGRRYC